METLNLSAGIVSLLRLLPTSIVASPEGEFSRDSASALLRTLSVEIGPRPMGSPAEQRAMAFAVDRLRQSGCQEAYVMPMTVAEGVNTNSGIAVGVLKGMTGRIIILGGHIDSAGPDVLGVNDDGSGAACVLELARVLSKEPHRSTIMFCCWGGEERDLQGSKYFVEHFNRLDSVDLMLQIDMADGAGILEIDPDYGNVSAPQWLTEAAYQVFYGELQLSGLVYPTASATLNSATGGTTGSDHDSFLEKGIPAIDFTGDVDYPIHTPQDNFENFQPSGLKRSGDLVLHLVRKFDAGIPSRTTGRYMLLQFWTMPLFVPHFVLWVCLGASLIVGFVAVYVLRRRSVLQESAPEVRWSGFKLIVATVVIQTFVWSSATVLGYLKGYRFPWVNNFGGFAVLGVLAGLTAFWFVLHAFRRFRLSSDAFAFGWRAVAVLVVFTVLAALAGPELAIFFGMATAFMAFAFLVRPSGLRMLFFTLAVLVVLRLVFFEELGLIQRLIAENRIHSWPGLVSYHAGYILLFTLLSLPFVFGFATIYKASGRDLLWLRKFRTRSGLTTVLVAVLGLFVYLLMRPVYDARWYSSILVEQRYEIGADSSTIELRGSDYLDGTTMRAGHSQMALTGRTNYYRYAPEHPLIVKWASLEQRVDTTIAVEDSVSLTREVRLRSLLRPYTVTMSYTSELPFTVTSQWSHGGNLRLGRETDKRKIFSWYSFPDTNLDVPISFGLAKGQRVTERVEITYDSLACDLCLEREFTNMQYRTVISAVDTFFSDHRRGTRTEGGERE